MENIFYWFPYTKYALPHSDEVVMFYMSLIAETKLVINAAVLSAKLPAWKTVYVNYKACFLFFLMIIMNPLKPAIISQIYWILL